MAYTTATVNAWYQAVQFQNGATATVTTWVNALNAGQLTPAQVQNSIITQDAYTLGVVNPVLRLYQSSFNSVPDQSGQAYWVGQFGSGAQTYQQIANGFATSVQFTGIYGNTTATQIANQAQVTLLYQNILQRNPDAGGLAYWSTQPIGVALAGISASPEMTNVSSLPIQNFQAAEIAGTASGSGSLYNYPGFPTTTFTLTTGLDAPGQGAFAAGSPTGNSTIEGSMVYAAGGVTVDPTSTLNTSDRIQATGLNNTLNLTVSGGNATTTFVPANITGVQNFYVRNVSGNTNTLDAATVSGLTAYYSNLSTSAVTVTNLASGASAGIIGNGALTNGASNFGWAAGVTSATLSIAGGTAGAGIVTLSGAALTTQTIQSAFAANTIGALRLSATTTSLTINASTGLTTGAVTNTGAAALTTLTINGAGAVDISAAALEATVATINASGNSGGVTVALGSNVAQVVTGSSGNDTITTGGVLTTGSVNGGGGTADVLVVRVVGDVNTTSLAAKYTNFETLRLNGTLDMSLFPSITAIQLSGATNSITNMTATQAANVQARANIGATTLTLATATGTSDVLTITAGIGTSALAATTIGTLTATGFETINLIANPGSSAAVGADRTSSLTAISNSSLTAVNLTGTAWTLNDIASTKATTWTATGLTGNGASTPVGLTLTTTGAAAAGSVVNGSNLRDSVIMTTTTGVTFNLNSGNDLFSTTTTLLTPTGAATDNTVSAGGGTDTLIFTGAATATDTTFTLVSGFESLQLAGGAYDNSLTGLAAGFLAAYSTGVTVTDTTDQAVAQSYTWASGLYNQNVTLTHTSLGNLDAASSNQSITTGGGADNITLAMTAVVGAAGAAGNININTGAGNDTINVNVGANQILAVTGTSIVTINGGAGQDNITVNATHLNALAANLGSLKFVFDAGQSSTTAYDTVTGFLKANGTNISDTLDFSAVTLTTYAATAAAGYSSAELTVAVSAVGATTFAGTAAATLSVAQKIAAVASVVTANQGDSAFFIDSGSTYVFNNESAGDVVVQLVGQTGATALITTNATTANAIFIA